MNDAFVINSVTSVPAEMETVTIPAEVDAEGKEIKPATTKDEIKIPEHVKVSATFTFYFGKMEVEVDHPIAATDPKTGEVVLTSNLIKQKVDDIRVYTQGLTIMKTLESDIIEAVKSYGVQYKKDILAGDPALSHPLVGQSQSL